MSVVDPFAEDALPERGGRWKAEAEVPEPSVEAEPPNTDERRIGLGSRSLQVPRSESAKQEKARRGMARQRERAGVCPMYAPRGTTCKTCGKVHPL